MIPMSELRARVRLRSEDEHLMVPLRDSVIALWEKETGVKWSKVTGAVEVFEPDRDASTLFLPNALVSLVTKVEERAADVDDTWEELPADEWMQLGPRSLRRLGVAWSPAGTPKLIRVTYNGGYDSAPADVRFALATQALFMVERITPERISSSSQGSAGTYAVLMDPTMHPLFAAAVARYRRVA